MGAAEHCSYAILAQLEVVLRSPAALHSQDKNSPALYRFRFLDRGFSGVAGDRYGESFLGSQTS